MSARDFEPPQFHARRPGLLRPVPVDPTGRAGPTARQVRRKGWRRTGPGLYLPAHLACDSLDQRLVEVATSLPRESALTGWAALHWFGVRWTEGLAADGSALPIPVLVFNHRLHERPDVLISAEKLRPRTIRWLDDVPVTTALRSVCFEARHAPNLLAAVRWLDIVLASDLVSLAELTAYLPRLTAWTGVPQLRQAVALADENVWSPMETEMRLLWTVTLGLSRVVSNHPVFDREGHFIGTPDLLDEELGVAGEYDGPLHLAGHQRAKDLRREGDLRRVGLEYVTMTAADRRDPQDFLRRTVDARRRARQLSGPRLWTIDPPAWWTPTTTVAARRALTEEQRARYLLRRAG